MFADENKTCPSHEGCKKRSYKTNTHGKNHNRGDFESKGTIDVKVKHSSNNSFKSSNIHSPNACSSRCTSSLEKLLHLKNRNDEGIYKIYEFGVAESIRTRKENSKIISKWMMNDIKKGSSGICARMTIGFFKGIPLINTKLENELEWSILRGVMTLRKHLFKKSL